MRKINKELNSLKLEQKKLQLAQIENQLGELMAKVAQVQGRFYTKQEEVNQLELLLNDTQSVAVSE